MTQRRQYPTRAQRLAAIATLTAGMILGGSAQAATFDVSDAETYGGWQAATLTRSAEGEQERHFRAVDTTSYGDATLSVNATPGVCDMPWLEVRVALNDAPAEAGAVDVVPAQLRVDDRTLRPAVAEFFTEPDNNGFYVHFYLNDLAGLLDDMRAGQQLFLGFEQGEREPWYMTFGLDGAESAVDEALARCWRAK
ncbi:hypothetical protein P1P91_14330 [Halomonas piscis]|uniref:Uncharacterized protein n=1 Tax=Halomonas piscis TaxID=3031727 RepID=A0ABY9YYP2_9GAMM|nr:hypothetical protein [Halomonas piscis]WNK19983.1 hypothetical protein P1P91_14330 [Halomonas piscis]